MAKKTPKKPKTKKVAGRKTAETAESTLPGATVAEPPAEISQTDAAPEEGPVPNETDTEGAVEATEASGTEAPLDHEQPAGDPVESPADAQGSQAEATDPQTETTDSQAEPTDPQAEATPPGDEGGTANAQSELSPEEASGGEATDAALEADPVSPEGSRLESIIESLLFASDKALGLADLRRLLGERDGKKITAAVQSLMEKRKDSGIQIVALSTGWHLRTHVENAAWVSRLLVGRPVRLSRAMMETLAIVAYRQPVTRPEVDEIRGVDCGPVLKTLLDRGLVRIIGKKEEVGRPLLYGTTPEFLRVFNLRDLSELPTLREFYDLSEEHQSRVDAEHGDSSATPSPAALRPDVSLTSVSRGALAPEPEDADPLLDELDEASKAAKAALGGLEPDSGEGAEPQPAPAEESKLDQDPTPPSGE